MAVLDTTREPTPRELRVFGLLFALFFALIGGVVIWKSGPPAAAITIWAIALIATVLYYALPPLQRTFYRAWMAIFFPIGWTLSHLILAVTYYLIVTPVGLIMRMAGRDTMEHRFDLEAPTYWSEHGTPHDPARYFDQF